MYSLFNVSLLYIGMGSLCMLVYFNIPEDLNTTSISRWILLLSTIYFVLGFSRLRKHFQNNE